MLRRPLPAGVAAVALTVAMAIAAPACSGGSDGADRAPTTAAQASSTTSTTTTTTTSTTPPDAAAPGDSAITGDIGSTTVAADVVGTGPATPAEPVAGDAVPDGTSFGFVQGVGVATPSLTIDIAQLLTGDAAVLAAIEDGAIGPTETSVDNDYYIRNLNPKLRTAPIAGDAVITMLTDPGSPDSQPSTLNALSRRFVAQPGYPVQISATGGRIVRIDELFFP